MFPLSFKFYLEYSENLYLDIIAIAVL